MNAKELANRLIQIDDTERALIVSQMPLAITSAAHDMVEKYFNDIEQAEITDLTLKDVCTFCTVQGYVMAKAAQRIELEDIFLNA